MADTSEPRLDPVAETVDERLERLEQRLDELTERLDRRDRRATPPPAPQVDTSRPIDATVPHRPGFVDREIGSELTVRKVRATADYL